MNQAVIILVGFSRSGKTTLAREIRRRFEFLDFHIVSGDPIHVYLDTQFSFFADDGTVFGRAFWTRRNMTAQIQLLLLRTFLDLDLSVIMDLANLRRIDRERIITTVRALRPLAKIMIVFVECPEEELLKQIRHTEAEAATRGAKPAYFDLYAVVEKPTLERPVPDEADLLLHCSWDTEEETLTEIERFLADQTRRI